MKLPSSNLNNFFDDHFDADSDQHRDHGNDSDSEEEL